MQSAVSECKTLVYKIGLDPPYPWFVNLYEQMTPGIFNMKTNVHTWTLYINNIYDIFLGSIGPPNLEIEN